MMHEPQKAEMGLSSKRVEIARYVIGAALKCAPIMEWEFILASGRSSF